MEDAQRRHSSDDTEDFFVNLEEETHKKQMQMKSYPPVASSIQPHGAIIPKSLKRSKTLGNIGSPKIQKSSNETPEELVNSLWQDPSGETASISQSVALAPDKDVSSQVSGTEETIPIEDQTQQNHPDFGAGERLDNSISRALDCTLSQEKSKEGIDQVMYIVLERQRNPVSNAPTNSINVAEEQRVEVLFNDLKQEDPSFFEKGNDICGNPRKQKNIQLVDFLVWGTQKGFAKWITEDTLEVTDRNLLLRVWRDIKGNEMKRDREGGWLPKEEWNNFTKGVRVKKGDSPIRKIGSDRFQLSTAQAVHKQIQLV